MSPRLPLIAAQPGIWMAEALSTLPNAWSVAHYVELNGKIDGNLLARAIVMGMSQADTLRMRFSEDHGEVWQWLDESMAIAEPACHDLRGESDPQQARKIAASTAAIRSIATSFSALAITSGSGISVTIIYWWTGSASRQ